MKRISVFIFVFSSFSWALAPDISANVLFLYQNSNFHQEKPDPTDVDQERNGLNLREAELQFFSDVDPYTRLNILLSIHPEFESDGTEIEETWKLEPEELYFESNSFSSVTLKAGKFKAFMGPHNQLHTHAFLFIKAPLANEFLLGDEGLNDLGLSAAWLLPTSWFNELTLQFLRGEGENAEFSSPTAGDGVGLIHWKNLWDLSDEMTFEAGLSYADGSNSFEKKTSLVGADFTLKWKPVSGSKRAAFIWSTEALSRTQKQESFQDEVGSGLASSFVYQFADRWSALYRFDTLTVKNSFAVADLPNRTMNRHSVALQFQPSEFSLYKLEFDSRTGGLRGPDSEKTEQSLFLQANFTIGAHPAHSY